MQNFVVAIPWPIWQRCIFSEKVERIYHLKSRAYDLIMTDRMPFYVQRKMFLIKVKKDLKNTERKV